MAMSTAGSLPLPFGNSRLTKKPRVVQITHRAIRAQSTAFPSNDDGTLLAAPKGRKIRIQGQAKKLNWVRRSFLHNLFPDPPPNLESPSDAVKYFYASINGKDLKSLGGVFSDDCVFEDLAFLRPFKGVKNIMSFLKDLVAAMRESVQFSIENTLEGDASTVAVMWHLEWNGKAIPLTKGFSFFECEKSIDGFVIKKVRVVAESPLKPGRLALELLKIVSAVFDRFPNFASNFLREPYAVLQFMTKMYKIFIEPFILPFLLYYTRVWAVISSMLRRIFSIVLKVLGPFI